MPEIKSIVREQVVSASPDTSLADLAQLMEEENVGSVIIVEEEQPRGNITDRDIAIEVVAHDQDATSMTAADVMSEDLVTVDIDSGIFEVIRAMEEAGVRRIPAIDPDGHPRWHRHI